MNGKEAYLREELSRQLEARALNVRKNCQFQDRALYPDIELIAPDGVHIQVECKVIGPFRAPVFSSFIGDAILRRNHRVQDAELLLAFLVNRLSPRAIEIFKAYAEKYLPELNWFILDEEGVGCLRFRGKDEDFLAIDSPFKNRSRMPKRSSSHIFSPNNQWLLKILLLPGIAPRYWGGPMEGPHNINHLAELSGVSQPSCSVFISKLEESGYLIRSSKEFQIRRHVELLNEWYYAHKASARFIYPVRPLYGGELSFEKVLEVVRQSSANSSGDKEMSFVVGHQLGCELLGAQHSNVVSGLIYFNGDVDKALSHLQWVHDYSGESPFALAVPWSKKSVMKSFVNVDGVSVCDVLQCYLDVRSARARGEEQASFLYERILEPHFRRHG